MKYAKILITSTILLSGCISKSDIKKEIADYHACITKCEDIESTNTFNFYKCSQACVDLFERKKAVLNTLDKSVQEKGMVEIAETRNQCIGQCQEKVISVRAEVRAQIKKCMEICIYNLKK